MEETGRELPVPVYLTEEERTRTRGLYETVFSEDSQRFVDFYYRYKIRDNQILALWEDGQYVSMLHLNPYRMIAGGYEFQSNYIVAVATLKDYRHRGYMRLLLETALRDMAARHMPFTFLMPASESIYAPFDFVWICPFTEVPGRVERMEAEEQNRYLAARYQVFCKRDARYLENLRAEREAEKGEAQPEKIPPFMARITDVPRMLHLARSQEKREWYLHIKDAVIAENDGYFHWVSDARKSCVEKLKEEPGRLDLEMSVGELTGWIFGAWKICLSEVV